MQFVASRSIAAAALAADLSDAAADRRVYLAAGGLALLGLVMTVATAWWWHATRPDHPALGPLEAMSRPRFAALSDTEQRALLDAARPRHESVAAVAAVAAVREPPVDLRRSANEPLVTVDDLRDPDDITGPTSRAVAGPVSDDELADVFVQPLDQPPSELTGERAGAEIEVGGDDR